MEQNKRLNYDRELLPVLASGDLLVVGGSFGGAAAALAAAQLGCRVVLVEPRTYLGREAAACLRPFFSVPGDAGLPSLLQSCISIAGVSLPEQGLRALKLGVLKKHLEDVLLDAGVKILYASQPVDLVSEAGQITGIIIGNKSGRQVIRAQAVVDATETELLFRLAEGGLLPDQAQPPKDREESTLFYRTLEFVKVGAVSAGWLALPEGMGIAGNEVRLVPGYHDENHWFVECPLALPANTSSPFDLTAREIVARHRTMALASYLRKHVQGFEKAVLASASQLLAGPIVSKWSGKAALTGELESGFISPGCGLPDIQCTKIVGPLIGLYRMPDSSHVHLEDRDRVLFYASAVGEALGNWLGNQLAEKSVEQKETLPSQERTIAAKLQPEAILQGVQIKEPESPQRGYPFPSQHVSPSAVPVLKTVDVLVIGGGTSGATAAYAAAKSGVRTLLVEALPGLGGTGTIGGVHSYWFGRRQGFSRQVIQAVEAMHAELGLEPPQGGLLKWNIEAKMHALLRRALDAGVEILWGSVAAGTLVDGKRVRGVIVGTPLGPAALCAKVIIDATGDGDVAYFAGAQSVYGSLRDHTTMWYSLAQFHSPGMTKNNFTSMVDVGNVEDYTRAVLAGRQRAEGYDQGTYIAPRESRHILADVVMTLNDQLLKRCWPDTVNIAFSNHDVKGHSSSDWLRLGLIPPNLEVEIPYRALLPKNLEGILVAGKAFSATHDALPALRMQPDLENLGGAAGTAAAIAVRSGRLPREIDVPALQQKLVQEGVLPERILRRRLEPRVYTHDALQSLVDQMVAAKPLNLYQDMDLDVVFEERIPFAEICTAGPAAVEILDSALKKHTGPERMIIAKALAAVGSDAGVKDLVEALHALTPDEGLQHLQAHIRHVQLPPDQGAMPEAANLLYALGMARSESTLPVWDHFSSIIADTDESMIRDRSLGLFYYIDAICYGAERLGDPRAVPFLKRMHANLAFRGRSMPAGFQVDFFLERLAYLELVIARAMARCGDRQGYEALIGYLNDPRALLAEHAHSELRSITAQDFGKDPHRWLDWLSTSDTWHNPHPVEEPTEPVLAWNEEILWEL